MSTGSRRPRARIRSTSPNSLRRLEGVTDNRAFVFVEDVAHVLGNVLEQSQRAVDCSREVADALGPA